jgi:hypothetical protein
MAGIFFVTLYEAEAWEQCVTVRLPQHDILIGIPVKISQTSIHSFKLW